MLEKGKISNYQATLLLIAGVLATGLLSFPSLLAFEAKQDAWLSVFLAAGVALGIILIVTALGRRFPGQTMVQYSETILGPILGRIVGAVFIWFFLFLNAISVREFGEFMITIFMEETPLTIFTVSILAVAALAIYGGLEVIGRVNEMMLSLVVLAFLVFMLLAVNEMVPARLTPVLTGGIRPVIKGSIITAGWLGEVLCLGFLIPFLNHPAMARRSGTFAVLILSAILGIAVITSIMTFGPVQTGRIQFPTFRIARNVSVMGILERFDALFMLLWIAGLFSKITIYFYITVLSAAQWFKLSDYRPLILPLGAIAGALVFLCYENNIELISFILKVWGPYALSIEIGFPALLLLAATIFRKGNTTR